jgi:hypothetical protein
VTWSYSAKKISEQVYELHLKANIERGWHIYSQDQGEDFLGNPARIKFNKHPLVELSGKTLEAGTLKKSKDPILEIESAYYAGEVDFIQKITVKNNAKTRVSGSIEFQLCTDEKCLPPATVNFSVAIN